MKGVGPQPKTGVTTYTQTCPGAARSEGPFHAKSWAALHPHHVTYRSRPAQTVLSVGGNPVIGRTFDPAFGGLACQQAPTAAQGPGIATYRLPAAVGSGYLLLGSPTVTANLKVTGQSAYVAARLLDVNPTTHTETLVARGIYRLDPGASEGRHTFQLYGAGWRFAHGHIPVLQLLGEDAPYTRPANGVFTVAVSNLTLLLPVHEETANK